MGRRMAEVKDRPQPQSLSCDRDTRLCSRQAPPSPQRYEYSAGVKRRCLRDLERERERERCTLAQRSTAPRPRWPDFWSSCVPLTCMMRQAGVVHNKYSTKRLHAATAGPAPTLVPVSASIGTVPVCRSAAVGPRCCGPVGSSRSTVCPQEGADMEALHAGTQHAGLACDRPHLRRCRSLLAAL